MKLPRFAPLPPSRCPLLLQTQPLAALPPLDTSSQRWWSSLFACVCGGLERTDKEGKGERDSSPKGSDNTERGEESEGRGSERKRWDSGVMRWVSRTLGECQDAGHGPYGFVMPYWEGGMEEKVKRKTEYQFQVRNPLYFSSVPWSLESFE